MNDAKWERWARGMGVVFVVLVGVAFGIFGEQPKVEDSAAEAASFYQDGSGRILTAVVLFGFAAIALFWFVGAVANALRTAGEGRLAASTIALITAWVSAQFITISVGGALAVKVADTAGEDVTYALNTLALAADNLSSFPIAGALVAVGAGLTRARLMPAWYLWGSLAAAVILVLHGTNWAEEGFWSPGGGYIYVVVPVGLLWTVVTSVLLFRAPLPQEPAPPAAA
ncbi:MAG: hypothetical protein ABR583_14285 [Gaiellaceae bacterium]